MVGDGDEAENIFQEGLKISNAQYLPLGQAAFRSCLGEIYHKHLHVLGEQFDDGRSCGPIQKLT